MAYTWRSKALTAVHTWGTYGTLIGHSIRTARTMAQAMPVR